MDKTQSTSRDGTHEIPITVYNREIARAGNSANIVKPSSIFRVFTEAFTKKKGG